MGCNPSPVQRKICICTCVHKSRTNTLCWRGSRFFSRTLCPCSTLLPWSWHIAHKSLAWDVPPQDFYVSSPSKGLCQEVRSMGYFHSPSGASGCSRHSATFSKTPSSPKLATHTTKHHRLQNGKAFHKHWHIYIYICVYTYLGMDCRIATRFKHSQEKVHKRWEIVIAGAIRLFQEPLPTKRCCDHGQVSCPGTRSKNYQEYMVESLKNFPLNGGFNQH